MNNNKFKLITLFSLIIMLIFIIIYSILGGSISFLSVKEIKNGRKLKDDLISSLKINNIDTIYDKNNNIYYYNIPEGYESNNYVLKIYMEDGYKYKLINKTLNIIKVDYNKPIDIIIYNDKYYYKTKIQLTNLPLISIETDEIIDVENVRANFKYINTSETNKVITSNSKIHIRGSSSLYSPKKSYRINMYDTKFKDEENIQISNFYYGDSFILDAVYRDKSKIRNVLSTHIWNEISNDFSNVDIYSEYVELFINNEYKGLYVFTEPINRKKLNLPKSTIDNTSAVIKMIGWTKLDSNTLFENIEEYSYMNYEIKYPNKYEWYSDVWKKLISTINKYYDPNVPNTDTIIKNTFNLKNYIDITLFNSFTNNTDNCLSYNNYFYFKSLNDEIYIQPWDMEFSYGYYMDEKFLPRLEYDKISCQFYQTGAPKTNKLLIDRYWQLRKNILTEEYLNNILDKYKKELTKGAALRDSALWEEYNIEKEIEDVRTWLHKRLEFFDEYVKGLEHE